MVGSCRYPIYRCSHSSISSIHRSFCFCFPRKGGMHSIPCREVMMMMTATQVLRSPRHVGRHRTMDKGVGIGIAGGEGVRNGVATQVGSVLSWGVCVIFMCMR